MKVIGSGSPADDRNQSEVDGEKMEDGRWEIEVGVCSLPECQTPIFHLPSPFICFSRLFPLILSLKSVRRERKRSLLLLSTMLNTELIETVSRRVEDLIQDDPSLFLVGVRIKPTLNIRVYIDGDQGVSVERLIRYNRALYRQLVEQGVLPDGEFSLEFSSPGVGEPLKLHRQYLKNMGRQVEVVALDDSQVIGKLIAVTDDGFTVEAVTGKGKKQEVKTHSWNFNEIKTTTIQITF